MPRAERRHIPGWLIVCAVVAAAGELVPPGPEGRRLCVSARPAAREIVASDDAASTPSGTGQARYVSSPAEQQSGDESSGVEPLFTQRAGAQGWLFVAAVCASSRTSSETS